MATRSDAFRQPDTATLTWHAMTSAEVEQSLSTSDKTGTLTRNEMTVQRVVCAGHAFNVGGWAMPPWGT